MIGRFLLAGVVLASVSFAGGFLARPLVVPTEAYREDLGVGAYVTVRAYHADGSLFAVWEGHNALTSQAKKAIVGCLSGLDTTPNEGPAPVNFPPTTGCTSLTHTLRVSDSVGGFTASKLATKGITPDGCVIDLLVFGSAPGCTGWKLEATFDSEITQAASINAVTAVMEFGGGTKTLLTGQVLTAVAPDFNQIAISPAIAVAAGDRLIITLNFNVP